MTARSLAGKTVLLCGMADHSILLNFEYAQIYLLSSQLLSWWG
jgi:hypothetical protein